MDYRQQIFQLAKSFINIPLDQVDTWIQTALQQTAEYFSADRSYIFDYNFSARTISNTYEWCAPGISKEIDNLQNVPMSRVVEWITAHSHGDPVIVPDVSTLPSRKMRMHLEAQQIKSLIILPMMNKTDCIGCIGFDAVTDHRHFGSEEIDLLSIFAGLLVDLRERSDHEKQLRDKERRLSAVIDGTQAGTWEWNVQTGETLFNNQWAQMLGLDLSDLEPTSIKTWQDLVNPDDMKVAERLLQQHFSGQTNFYRCEVRMRHKKGHWVWIQDTGRVYEWTKEGLPLLMAGTHQDISWRKRVEEELKKQEQQRLDNLKIQRDTLVREVHHRIKNHLQGALGLMHNSTADQPDLAAMMEPVIRRIKSIADVYGINATNIDTAITVSELIGRIICSYPEQDQIELSSEEGTQFLTLQIEEAVPTSLIINELLNNAVKHRLTRSPPRPVKIALSRVHELTCLTIASGPAYLPADFDMDVGISLGTGLELVQALMPSQDNHLELEQQGDEVVATYCFLADSQPHISASS